MQEGTLILKPESLENLEMLVINRLFCSVTEQKSFQKGYLNCNFLNDWLKKSLNVSTFLNT
jgi:hypothetical protein